MSNLELNIFNLKLLNKVPIEMFKENHISKPFNPILANMFYKAGFVESWGKGTNNIVEDCLKMDLPELEYRYTFASVQVIFYKNPLKTPLKTKDKIIEFIENNRNISIKEIADKLNLSRDTINEHLSRLKRDKIIKRVGSARSGYWEVLDVK